MRKKRKFMCALGCKTKCFTCSEVEKSDKKRGGTRKGSGTKPKYNEEKKTVAFPWIQ